MNDFYEFGSTFWLSLTTLIFGFGGACLAYGLRSKCSHIKFCCGCVDITRDIEAEVELEQTTEQAPITPTLEQPPRVRRKTPPVGHVSFNDSMLTKQNHSNLVLEKLQIHKELSNNNV